jgi:signal transduction histidine kinase
MSVKHSYIAETVESGPRLCDHGVPCDRSSEHHAEAAAEEGDEASRAHANFLRRVAHDIASPTGVVTTALEEIANSDAKRPELLAMARRGLRRLLRLSDQIGLLADLRVGSLFPERAPEDMRAVVKYALDQSLAIDGRRDVVASLHGPDHALMVDVDRRLLGSVIREVIGNALRLATSRVRLDIDRVGERIVLRVQDDGPGFSIEALANLVGNKPPMSSTRGLGLSLAMAREVLYAHDAELEVEQSSLPPGRRGRPGAAVVISLPLCTG